MNLQEEQIRWGMHSTLQKRILVVDDEPFNIIGLEIIIQQATKIKGLKHIIDQAKNGQEALDIVRDNYERQIYYPLIFMDC